MSAPMLIDDGDPAVQYSAGWAYDQGFAPAVYHTRHGAAVAGTNVSLTFDGTGIDVVTTLDPTARAGRPTTSYTIDGVHVETKTAPFASSGLTQFNFTAFSRKDLPPGSHVLTITNVNGTSPNIFWIDYFLVYGRPPSSPHESTTTATFATSPVGSVSATTHSVVPVSSATSTALGWSSSSSEPLYPSSLSRTTLTLFWTSTPMSSSSIGAMSFASNATTSSIPAGGSYTNHPSSYASSPIGFLGLSA
ncbi:hypothetical protein C8T65DRAFT_83204 [Cerioporus squamosus]|nr:hypothetical protein C8T65DRAFT_83204 [Cerioporus squamosus]